MYRDAFFEEKGTGKIGDEFFSRVWVVMSVKIEKKLRCVHRKRRSFWLKVLLNESIKSIF